VELNAGLVLNQMFVMGQDSVNKQKKISESIVFISLETYNGNLGGTTGADAKCQALATAEELSGTFVAWLSESTTDAKDRIILTEIPFNLTDRTVIADNLADLIDATLRLYCFQIS